MPERRLNEELDFGLVLPRPKPLAPLTLLPPSENVHKPRKGRQHFRGEQLPITAPKRQRRNRARGLAYLAYSDERTETRITEFQFDEMENADSRKFNDLQRSSSDLSETLF